jgi:hypothetical protein
MVGHGRPPCSGHAWLALDPVSSLSAQQPILDRLSSWSRKAGDAATSFTGGAAGLAVTAGVDFSTPPIGAFGLSFMPVVGQVIAVGARASTSRLGVPSHPPDRPRLRHGAARRRALRRRCRARCPCRPQRHHRRPAVNIVETIVATAERDGEVPFPLLSQANLCALGAAHKSGRSWFHHSAMCLPVPGRQGSGRLLAGSLIPDRTPWLAIGSSSKRGMTCR